MDGWVVALIVVSVFFVLSLVLTVRSINSPLVEQKAPIDLVTTQKNGVQIREIGGNYTASSGAWPDRRVVAKRGGTHDFAEGGILEHKDIPREIYTVSS